MDFWKSADNIFDKTSNTSFSQQKFMTKFFDERVLTLVLDKMLDKASDEWSRQKFLAIVCGQQFLDTSLLTIVS